MPNAEISIFENLMGDSLDAFYIMVEGALRNWNGIYDVILVDKKTYLIKAKGKKAFCGYCARLRASNEGEELCLKSDLEAAIIAGMQHREEGYVYTCAGGLFDIAAPIVVNSQVIAAILCGQVRPEDAILNTEGNRRAVQLEEQLGFQKGDLEKLRNQIHQNPEQELKDTARRLSKMTRFVSQILDTQLKLQDTNVVLNRQHEEQDRTIERTRQILQVMTPLFNLHKTTEEFWQTVDEMLLKITTILGAAQAAFLLYNAASISEPKTILAASANMPANLPRGTLLHHDHLFQDWESLDLGHGAVVQPIPEALFILLNKGQESPTQPLHSLVALKVPFSEQEKGLLTLFFDEDSIKKFDRKQEDAEINLIASRIAQAYTSTQTYLEKVKEEKQRREWIKRISHQVISPLNGALGHAASLKDFFDERRSNNQLSNWGVDDIVSWYNQLESLLGTIGWTATLARNLSWMADPESRRQLIKQEELKVIPDFPEFLIDCARYFQGAARHYTIRVHVERASVAPLSDRIQVYPNYFRMAIQNLLDNAVKYSNRNSDITVNGDISGASANIRVINYGIRLSAEECERVFEYGYRTQEALSRRKPGTGMGLFIAREIIAMHEGKLAVQPSEYSEAGWKTIFTITLPLMKPKYRY